METLTITAHAEQHNISINSLRRRVTYSTIVPVENEKQRRYLKKDLDSVLTGYEKHKASRTKAPDNDIISPNKLLSIRITTHGFRSGHDLTKFCGYRNEAEFNRVCKILKSFGNGAYID